MQHDKEGNTLDPYVYLHTQIVRLEERMRALAEKFESHMADEEKVLGDALAEVKAISLGLKELEKKVEEFQTSAKVARWVVGGIAAGIAWLVAMKANIVGFFRG